MTATIPTGYGSTAAAKIISEATSTPESIQLAIGACIDKLLKYSATFVHFKSLEFKGDGILHVEMNPDRVPCIGCGDWFPLLYALHEHEKVHPYEDTRKNIKTGEDGSEEAERKMIS